MHRPSLLSRMLAAAGLKREPPSPGVAETLARQREVLESLQRASAELQRERDVLAQAIDGISAVKLKEKVMALNESKRFVTSVVDAMEFPVVAVDLEGRVTFWNRAAEVLTGHAAADVKGVLFETLLYAGARNIVSETFRVGRPCHAEKTDLRSNANERLRLAATTSLLQGADGKTAGAVCVFQELRRLERLGLAGASPTAAELASGVARCIRNRLGILSGYLQLLPSKYADESFRRNFIEIVSSEMAKLSNVSDRLLDFDDTQQVTEDVAPNALLSRVLMGLRETAARQKVDVRTVFREPLPMLRCPGAGLHRAFSAVLINALESMPSGGALTVETSAAADTVTVSIGDTGCGIPQENIGRIFEPFFTTKNESGGLGLTVARKIVEECGGGIAVSSRVHEGTSVTVSLPHVGSVQSPVSEA